jgi:hypothetical protein
MATGVTAKHKDYDRFYKKWKRVRDVVAGQDEIHAAGVAYLPMLVDETAIEYGKRVQRTPFYNASWRTMASFVGMLFRKPPTLEAPAKLEPLLEDVTMSGVSFNNFAQDVTLEDIEVSRIGVLVDFPIQHTNSDGSPLTLAQAEALGLRPSMTMYKAEAIINWKYGRVANAAVLTQVRLFEVDSIEKNEFEIEEFNVIRVLDLFNGEYRVRKFKEENGEQIGWDIYPLMNGKRLNFIPFYFIGPDGSEKELTEPVLIDLVDMNIKHYQVSADYEHGCHFAGLPTPVISGVNPSYDSQGQPIKENYYIGSAAAWVLPTGGDAKYLEFTGQGLEALAKNLERKEAQMAAIGARMLTPEKAGVEAAETLAMRHSGEHSILGAIAIAVSEGLTKALITFAEWAGVNSANIKFEINRDFMPYAITPQALTSLISSVQAGLLSHEAFFDLLKRGDLIESDVSFEDEQARIDAAPALPEPVAGQPGEDEDEDEDEAEA